MTEISKYVRTISGDESMVGENGLPAAVLKADDPGLLAAAACTDDVMKETLAQRKELAALRAAIEECKTTATAEAFREAAKLKAEAAAEVKIEPQVGPLRKAISAAGLHLEKLQAQLATANAVHQLLPQTVFLVPNAAPSAAQKKSSVAVALAQLAVANGHRQVSTLSKSV